MIAWQEFVFDQAAKFIVSVSGGIIKPILTFVVQFFR